ncbi:MAG TPA: NlpC/P60 family protein [Actinoplanes sp.]|nr:NlpC/P60 family protein [Actinoplanes sp.]
MSLGLALCAGQLVASPAASAATPTATVVTAAAAAKARPKVTQSVNKRAITWGSTVKVTARVVDSTTGKLVTSGGTIRLQGYRAKAWKTWQSRTLPKSGVITFTSKPMRTVSYRTVYLGNAGYTSGSSHGLKVTVKYNASKVLAEAQKHVGALYKFGAAGPKRFDCSGFTMYVYQKAAGRKLPHKANSQQRYGKAISKSQKKPGDLIVFRSGSYGYHVGIYAGGGKMYDSPRTGKRVSKRTMFSTNYVVRRLV